MPALAWEPGFEAQKEQAVGEFIMFTLFLIWPCIFWVVYILKDITFLKQKPVILIFVWIQKNEKKNMLQSPF
jgi:hypothetical protein